MRSAVKAPPPARALLPSKKTSVGAHILRQDYRANAQEKLQELEKQRAGGTMCSADRRPAAARSLASAFAHFGGWSSADRFTCTEELRVNVSRNAHLKLGVIRSSLYLRVAAHRNHTCGFLYGVHIASIAEFFPFPKR